jgi:hypothetical protein
MHCRVQNGLTDRDIVYTLFMPFPKGPSTLVPEGTGEIDLVVYRSPGGVGDENGNQRSPEHR